MILPVHAGSSDLFWELVETVFQQDIRWYDMYVCYVNIYICIYICVFSNLIIVWVDQPLQNVLSFLHLSTKDQDVQASETEPIWTNL